jgi:hypothetical protein
LIAAAGAVVLFELAQRSKVTPDQLDRPSLAPDIERPELAHAVAAGA